MQKLLRHFCLIIILLPLPTLAAVTINEVAWMGDSTSANHEWIELYNSGDTASDLSGWVLSDGQNLNINLSGSLGAKAYGVLERTSEESAPGTAFLIYTGALVNTGATLTIKNPAGTIVEQVAGGENWSNIGGDNATKETAQYTSAGWVTAVATPGKQNESSKSEVVDVAETPENDTEQTKSATNKTVSKSSSDTVFFKDLDSKLILKPDIKTVAYVNQKIPFKVEASGLGRDLLASLVYTWNFGDSFEAYGKETQHSYSYPGKYVVTLHGKVAENEAIVKAEITVLPVTFSISRNDQGDVQINNNAPYDIDISGYKLIGAKTVVMPARTIMLAKGTVTIDRERLELGNRPSQIYLYDSSLHLVASDLPSGESKAELSVSSESRSLPLPVSSHTASQSKTNFTFVTTTETLETTDNLTLPPEEFVGTESNVIEKEPTKSKDIQWPYALFIALLLGAFTVIIYSKNKDE